MKRTFIVFLFCMIGLPVFIFAGLHTYGSLASSTSIPSKVQKVFGKNYPQAKEPIWSRQGNYYVADFMADGFRKEIWFNESAHGVMQLTDWKTLDQLPAIVYNSFTLGTFSNWEVENVTLAEFPNCPTMIVIKVGQYNMDVQYQLFYSQDGLLLHTRNVSYISDTLTPSTFGCG